MNSLRRLAKGKPCYLRLTGCTHDTAQTVLAHVRRGGIAGAGQKPPDICGFPACDNCHGIYDQRYRAHSYTRTELDAEALRALVQWQAWLWSNEYVIPGGIAA